jgi:uncharacterized phage protein (TIGR02218 family)
VKTIPIALQAEYDRRASTICACLKVTRSDAVVVGFTSHDQSLSVSGTTYIPGFSLSALSSSEALNVDNLELTILPDENLPAEDLIAGLWTNAAFEVFEVNWKDTSDGVNVLKRGTTGEVRMTGGAYVVEFRGLSQALQQTQGIVTQKTCRARLGDSRCTKDLAAFTHTGTLTGVSSRFVVTDSARAEAAGYFSEGVLTMTSGPAEGYRQKVKTFSSGAFTLSLPLPFLPAVGNTYSVVAGCRKRLAEDCAAKFDNVLNFQGEPHLPGMDALSKPAAAEVQPEGEVPPLTGEPDVAGNP